MRACVLILVAAQLGACATASPAVDSATAAPDAALPSSGDASTPPDLTPVFLAQGCNDGRQDGDETDVDCGGSCSPCGIGRMCATAHDCVSDTCVSLRCALVPAVISFAAPMSFPVGGMLRSLAVADFNRDGFLDAAVVTEGNTTEVVILLGAAKGVLAPGPRFAVAAGDPGIVASDLDGDQNPDLAVTSVTGNVVNVFLGNGDGSFQGARTVSGLAGPIQLAAADFNADGNVDLAVAESTGASVHVLVGNGIGDFESAGPGLPVGKSPRWLATGDLDGDGVGDLAVANEMDGTVSVLLGVMGGGFGAARAFAVGAGPQGIVVGSFNGDAHPDLAIADGSGLSLLFGTGGGLFQAATHVAAGTQSSAVATADFQRDGHLDLAVADAPSGRVFVFAGDGGGDFVPAANLVVGTTPVALVAADFDGDGRTDLVLANATSADCVLLLNTSQ